MIETIKHIYRVVESQVREHLTKGLIGRLTGKRSSGWALARKLFLVLNSTCASCGGKSFLNVHHILPFHLKPKLELDPKNLKTLCMGKYECHLRIGHSGDWRAYNCRVEEHTKDVLTNPSHRTFIELQARLSKRYS